MTVSLALSRLSPRWHDVTIALPDWAWLLLIAAPLRLVNLGQEPLWYDELFQIWWAKMPLAQMLTITRGDVHPPLWYLIEWVTVRIFGDSEFAVRLPAALLGLLAVWLTWRLALALGLSRQIAYVAGLLTAFMPAMLYYSQDARMYPLLTCCVLIAAIAAIRGSWPVFTIAGIGAVYSQNLGWFYIAVIGALFTLSHLQRDVFKYHIAGRTFKEPGAVPWLRLRGPVAAAAAIGIAYVPWLPNLIYQMQLVRGGYWIQPLTPGAYLFPYAKMIMGWRMPESMQAHAYGVALAMTVLAVIVARKWLRTHGGAILLGVAFGAPLLIGLVSVLWRSVYLDRAMLPATVALMPIWAYALISMSKPNRRIAQFVLIPMLAVGVFAHYFPVAQRNDLTPINYVKSQWQPGDILYILQTDGLATIHYYMPDYPYALMPESVTLGQSLSPETRAGMGFNEETIEQVAAQGYKRAWLIYAMEPMISQAELDYVNKVEKYDQAGSKYYGDDPYSRVYVNLVLLK